MESDHYGFERVAPNAWAAIATPAGAAVGNAGFVDLGGRALVIDCGYTPGAARDLRAAAEAEVGPIDRLVVTHPHYDHYFGAQAFDDVPIVATETTREVIVSRGRGAIDDLIAQVDHYLEDLAARGAPDWEQEQGRRIAAELPGMELVPPTDTFSGELDIGPARLLELGTGHSPSDSVVWVPGNRALFAADLLGVNGHLNLAHGDPESWLRFLDRLEALEPVSVVAGHGPPAGPEAIPTAREYIETLLALAAAPGEHEMPTEYEGWEFPEGFTQNLEALRAR
jgi:glyoxylase-like metal-dependent hydrolase (beta-lactamase superfamily II)